jgi:hypothetical protein
VSNFKFNPTQVTPQTSVTVALDSTRKADVFIVADDGKTYRGKRSEYSEALQRTMSVPRSGLFAELMLVQPPRWMVGLWADVDGGFRDARTGEFFSFEQMREILDARITELGLDMNLVNAYLHFSLADRNETVADEQAFWRTPFEQRMNKFRVSQ